MCPSPPRGHDACAGCMQSMCSKGAEPDDVGEPHPSRQSFGTTRRVLAWKTIQAGSHLGSTLKPGGAVLTRGVFRRSGSVACIRVDASPNEVLTGPIMHDGYVAVKSLDSVSEI